MVSGPVAAMILGDQGADVIKLEPIHGEQMRNLSEPHKWRWRIVLFMQSK